MPACPITARRSGLSPRGRGKPAVVWQRPRLARSIPAWAGETDRTGSSRGSPRVYPRVGGGNGLILSACEPAAGLSPRGRGKRSWRDMSAPRLRSIPAWAGETVICISLLLIVGVYPRVGGGNHHAAALRLLTHGLSPRGRGKRYPTSDDDWDRRSIPAWAGETRLRATSWNPARVYPRVGGGNGSMGSLSLLIAGLSPRGRGKP